MKLLWLTDLHFDFVSPKRKEQFFQSILRQNPDKIVITGDISRGKYLPSDLVLFSQNLPMPIYFVLGNHDYYGSNFIQVDALVDFICLSNTNLHPMGRGEVIELSSTVGLVGHHGWGDGRAGNGIHSPIQINDFHYIEDLIGLPRQELFTKLASLGRESADYFRNVLPMALNRYREVFIITHVPPFIEGTWHEGKLSAANFLPFFCNVSAGEAIRDVAKQFPDRRIIVLAGHTHSRAYYEEGNIECWAGEVIYGEPRIQTIFRLD